MKFKKTFLVFFMISTLLVGCSNKDNTKIIDELGNSKTQSDAIQNENMQQYSGNLSDEELMKEYKMYHEGLYSKKDAIDYQNSTIKKYENIFKRNKIDYIKTSNQNIIYNKNSKYKVNEIEYDKKIVSSVLLDQSENLLTQTMLCFYQIPSNININPNDNIIKTAYELLKDIQSESNRYMDYSLDEFLNEINNGINYVNENDDIWIEEGVISSYNRYYIEKNGNISFYLQKDGSQINIFLIANNPREVNLESEVLNLKFNTYDEFNEYVLNKNIQLSKEMPIKIKKLSNDYHMNNIKKVTNNNSYEILQELPKVKVDDKSIIEYGAKTYDISEDDVDGNIIIEVNYSGYEKYKDSGIKMAINHIEEVFEIEIDEQSVLDDMNSLYKVVNFVEGLYELNEQEFRDIDAFIWSNSIKSDYVNMIFSRRYDQDFNSYVRYLIIEIPVMLN